MGQCTHTPAALPPVVPASSCGCFSLGSPLRTERDISLAFMCLSTLAGPVIVWACIHLPLGLLLHLLPQKALPYLCQDGENMIHPLDLGPSPLIQPCMQSLGFRATCSHLDFGPAECRPLGVESEARAHFTFLSLKLLTLLVGLSASNNTGHGYKALGFLGREPAAFSLLDSSDLISAFLALVTFLPMTVNKDL